MASARLRDMTRGNTFVHLVSFALPTMLGCVFQQLYSLVDAAVVGKGVGTNALAAIGSTGWVIWLVLGICQGLTQAFAIPITQRFGAGDTAGVKKNLAAAIYLNYVCSVLLTVVFMFLASPLLKLIQTPQDIFRPALLYTILCFAATPIMMTYNLLSAVLRAFGDSRTPLVAVIISTVVNIVLDLVFVLLFRWGVVGAAVATVIGQALSMAFCALFVRKLPIAQLSREERKPDKALTRKMLRLGLPLAFQNSVICLGGLLVQAVVNGFGVTFVAGYTAGNKIFGLLEMAAVGLGFSMGTFSGQNYGAKLYVRLRRGLGIGFIVTFAAAVLVAGLAILLGRPTIMLFLSQEDGATPEVLEIGWQYLRLMCLCLPALYSLYIIRNFLQGLGDTTNPMISGFIELVARIIIILWLPKVIGYTGVYLSEVLAWVSAAIQLFIVLFIRLAKLKAQENVSELDINADHGDIAE